MCSLASDPVSQHMCVELAMALGASVPLMPMCGGGGKRREHGEMLRCYSCSRAGEGGTGAAGP